MHIVIPICIQMSLYAYRDGPFSNPYMHMGIKINPCMHTGIARWVVGLVTVLYVVDLKIANIFFGGNDGQKMVDKK